MTERDNPTAEDRAVLATIDALLDGEGDESAGREPLADFGRLLRDSAPHAAEDFRLRLRGEVIDAAAAEHAARREPWWQRRLTRRQVAAGIVGLGVGGAAVAVAKVGAFINSQAPASAGEGVRGWAFDQSASLPVTLVSNGARWLGPSNALYEYTIFQVQQERWQNSERFSLPRPTPGAAIPLSDGRVLPIPAYLPTGFRWQGIAALQDPGVGSGPIGSTSGGGGGSNLPWARFPAYNRRMEAYLVGGDAADRFLILTQLRLDGHPGVGISSFQFEIPAQAVPPMGSATPTPPAPADAAKLAALLLAQPASSGAAVTVRIGTQAVQETMVHGKAARWFHGVWAADGRWLDTDTWTTLVWEQGDLLYQLAGQQLSLAELIRVAESLPGLP